LIVLGGQAGLPLFLHLPPESSAENGMSIVTSGHGGLLPPGLPVGTIKLGENGKTFVQPYANVQRVNYVRIVRKPLDPNLKLGDP